MGCHPASVPGRPGASVWMSPAGTGTAGLWPAVMYDWQTGPGGQVRVVWTAGMSLVHPEIDSPPVVA